MSNPTINSYRNRRQEVDEEIFCLTVPIWVHDERLGLTYIDEIKLYNIPIGGWKEYTSATYIDPSESDSDITIQLPPEELWGLLEETDDGMLREAGLTLIETPQSFYEGAVEAACDKVWEEKRV